MAEQKEQKTSKPILSSSEMAAAALIVAQWCEEHGDHEGALLFQRHAIETDPFITTWQPTAPSDQTSAIENADKIFPVD